MREGERDNREIQQEREGRERDTTRERYNEREIQ